jgi:hypothetical protein
MLKMLQPMQRSATRTVVVAAAGVAVAVPLTGNAVNGDFETGNTSG